MLPTPPATPSLNGGGFKLSPLDTTCTALPPFSAMTPTAANVKRRGDVGTHMRQLSSNELSYYLPSRSDGVNDMYVHHGIRATREALAPQRVRLAWALQLVRHPLLASTISMRSYDDVAFLHNGPRSVDAALVAADARLKYFDDSTPQSLREMDLVDAYLNGPRTLGNDMLACLVVRAGTQRVAEQYGAAGPASAGDASLVSFEIMLCTTHFVGDGMALHTFMNELYTLLGGSMSAEDIADELYHAVERGTGLPPPLEDRLGLNKFQAVVGAVAQQRADAALLGGQVLPARKGLTRHTLVPTMAYDPDATRLALAKCKANGVTVAHAVFALCAVAWARQCVDQTQPTMIYSALNMRPHMSPQDTSFFHLAVGYFNVVLPSLVPRSLSTEELVWHRANQTKRQTIAAVKSPLSTALFVGTASARSKRSQHWAGIDDAAAEAGPNPGLGLGISLPQRLPPAPAHTSREYTTPPPMPAGKALMGVSMLGNLDGMYRQQEYPSIQMYALTTGSRQRAGGLLLFAYTLAGKLWISLGYDQNGFEQGRIPAFWSDVLSLIDDVLLS